MTINQRIKEVREYLGMTQTAFAASLDSHQGKVTDIEREKCDPRIRYLEKLRLVWKIDLNWVFTGQGRMFSDYSYHPQIEQGKAEEPSISYLSKETELLDVYRENRQLYKENRRLLIELQNRKRKSTD
jgi:DNA-binding XRE family transcriptional regulator